MSVITVPELAAEALGSYLAEHMNRRFGSTEASLTELIPLGIATHFIITSSIRCW